ncbi:ankyrin repeat domain-containing protein [Shewanella xiamenensis]|nr:ankyrin repeat domain-containing protein [Shewanella xiamenensis]UWH44069.1 ankyrin repeat domain-containing protein [Shewanella xiamenensis]
MRLNIPMNTELIHAVKAKDTLAVKRIIANGADLEGVDKNGMTALLHACELQSFELLKLLVDAGADVNHPNALGYRPLDIAYWQGEFRMGCYTTESQRMVSYLSRHGGKSFS